MADQLDGAGAVIARAVVAVLIAAFAPVVVSAPAVAKARVVCSTTDFAGSTKPTNGQSATRRPVVLVHGWNGAPMTDTGRELARRLPGKINTFTFDYSHWAAYWAADAHIAPCLADYITKVSHAYSSAGGDGKVIVVAHSMGGLAIRYAMSKDSVAKPVPASVVPYVITLGTPQLGSPWGGTFASRLAEVLQHVTGHVLPAASGMDGGKCLASHEKGAALPKGCGGLPPWLPAGVTLTGIAGDVTVNRTLFGFTLYSIPLFSDGIVPVPSAHGYSTSGRGGTNHTGGVHIDSRTDACKIDFQSLVQSTGNLTFAPAELSYDYVTLQDLQNDKFSPAVQAYLAGATFTAPCSHIGLTKHKTALDQTAALLRSEMDTLAATRPTQVVNVVAVDRNGNPRAGYTADREPGDVEMCGPSLAAIGPDIVGCSPSAAAADICWVTPDRVDLLCATDPWSKHLLHARSTTPIGPVADAAGTDPWALTLADGTQCRIRNGGAWGGRVDNYVGAYSCNHGSKVVLVKQFGPGVAVNRSMPTWTVLVGPLGRPDEHFPPPATERVVTAYFARSA